MRLTKKETKPVQQKSSTLSAAQRELYEINGDAVCPIGKWAGRTLKEINHIDGGYYQWLLKENIPEKYGLIRLKGSAMRPKTDKPRWQVFISHLGEQWCTIRVVEEKTTPAEIWWYE